MKILNNIYLAEILFIIYILIEKLNVLPLSMNLCTYLEFLLSDFFLWPLTKKMSFPLSFIMTQLTLKKTYNSKKTKKSQQTNHQH